MKVNITDIIFYSVILVMLIFYLLVVIDKALIEKVNLDLRLRGCGIPSELIPSITKEMVNNNYTTINNYTNYTSPEEELIEVYSR